MSSKSISRQHAMIIGLIFIGILFTAFFGMRAAHAFRKFNGHRPPPPGKVETDVELIRDWMTIPFISRMYHVHDETIFDALAISPKDNRDKSLKEINEELFPDQDEFVIGLVKAVVIAHLPPPTPAPAATAVPPLTTPGVP